jgi:hypothetical protein
MNCKHDKTTSYDKCYSGPVSRDENPMAHGGICTVETCQRCGATRKTNVNGNHIEEGLWIVRLSTLLGDCELNHYFWSMPAKR